jgi:hypothetical protein
VKYENPNAPVLPAAPRPPQTESRAKCLAPGKAPASFGIQLALLACRPDRLTLNPAVEVGQKMHKPRMATEKHRFPAG